jgi:hypothetical protein
MALSLRPVETARGARWVRDGFSLFGKRSLAFSALFVLFLFVAIVLSLVPLLGGLVQMMLLPLLSLGFMVAAQSALLGGPVKPAQFFEPLRGDPAKRRSLLILCLIYGVCAMLILLLCDTLSEHAMRRLQELMSKPNTPQAEIDKLLAEPGVAWAAIIGLTLGTALSVPFWHAPALVHWGGQGVAQSLFSSTLALWRSKGAFVVYSLSWAALVMLFGVLTAVVFGLLGMKQLASVVAIPAGLIFSTAFYVSLLFTFNDSFGGGIPPSSENDGPNTGAP